MLNKIRTQGLHSLHGLQAFSPPLILGCIFIKPKGSLRQRDTVRWWKDIEVMDEERLGSLQGDHTITAHLH